MKRKKPQQPVPDLVQPQPPTSWVRIELVTREDGSASWPEGAPLPVRWLLRPAMPCPQCLAVRLPRGFRAVQCAGHFAGKAHLRCAACKHAWTLSLG